MDSGTRVWLVLCSRHGKLLSRENLWGALQLGHWLKAPDSTIKKLWRLNQVLGYCQEDGIDTNQLAEQLLEWFVKVERNKQDASEP